MHGHVTCDKKAPSTRLAIFVYLLSARASISSLLNSSGFTLALPMDYSFRIEFLDTFMYVRSLCNGSGTVSSRGRER